MTEAAKLSKDDDLKSQIFVLRVPMGDAAAEIEHVNVGALTRHDTLCDAFDWINKRLSDAEKIPARGRRH